MGSRIKAGDVVRGTGGAVEPLPYLAWAVGGEGVADPLRFGGEAGDAADAGTSLGLRNAIYKTAFAGLSEGLMIVGQDGRIIEMNKAFCDYLKISANQAVGKEFHRFFCGKLADGVGGGEASCQLRDARDGSAPDAPMVTRRPVVANGRAIAWIVTAQLGSRPAKRVKTPVRRPGPEAEALVSAGAADAFDQIPTQNARFAEIKRLAARYADCELPVFLRGETGVGKEVFAHAIHQASRRAGRPLVCVNCASIPEELLESELFGYEAGAFTGGRRSGKKGKFELADGGTLFLDEIGEMPLAMQCKLLRVLQSQEVEKLGAERPLKVDIRFIAATNRNLPEAVESGAFRADLFYRLNVLPISIPALRERKEDIPALARLFLSELVTSSGRRVAFSRATFKQLEEYDWPGNVRELRNVVGRAFMTTEGDEIRPEDLLLTPNQARPPAAGRTVTIEDMRCFTERELIINCLRKYDGNFPRAAQALGIHRATLYSRLHKMGIPIEAFR